MYGRLLHHNKTKSRCPANISHIKSMPLGPCLHSSQLIHNFYFLTLKNVMYQSAFPSPPVPT